MDELTHVNNRGEARMVDVSQKGVTVREARAEGFLKLGEQTKKRLVDGDLPKGDVLAAARIAGIQAAKRTSDIIPLCHTIPLDKVEIRIEPLEGSNMVRIEAWVRCTWKTGVEMEALTAVSAAALTLYDMLKAVDKDMEITDIRLLSKTGGKSDYTRL